MANVFPVGRLEYDASGMILLTSDGELADRLFKAMSRMPKVYWMKVKGRPSEDTLYELRHQAHVKMRRLAGLPPYANTTPKIRGTRSNSPTPGTICCAAFFFAAGHPVEKLKRVQIGPIELGDLEEGHFRQLAPSEVAQLRKAMERAELAPCPVLPRGFKPAKFYRGTGPQASHATSSEPEPFDEDLHSATESDVQPAPPSAPPSGDQPPGQPSHMAAGGYQGSKPFRDGGQRHFNGPPNKNDKRFGKPGGQKPFRPGPYQQGDRNAPRPGGFKGGKPFGDRGPKRFSGPGPAGPGRDKPFRPPRFTQVGGSNAPRPGSPGGFRYQDRYSKQDGQAPFRPGQSGTTTPAGPPPSAPGGYRQGKNFSGPNDKRFGKPGEKPFRQPRPGQAGPRGSHAGTPGYGDDKRFGGSSGKPPYGKTYGKPYGQKPFRSDRPGQGGSQGGNSGGGRGEFRGNAGGPPNRPGGAGKKFGAGKFGAGKFGGAKFGGGKVGAGNKFGAGKKFAGGQFRHGPSPAVRIEDLTADPDRGPRER